MNPLIDQLRAAVGAPHVLTDGDLGAWEEDWRKRMRGKALAVVRPGSTAEVAAVVRACAEAGTSIVPQGGNTGLVSGGVPDASGTQVVLVSVTRVRCAPDARSASTSSSRFWSRDWRWKARCCGSRQSTRAR